MSKTPAVSPSSAPAPNNIALEWTLLGTILLLAAFLRLWRIGQNGTGNPHYAACVRSMWVNWHNFFFVSFDPVGFVTVDKPPVSLCIQTAFAKLLGYRGFTLILPQALEGLGVLALVYHLVRRRFGPWAALTSALVVALSPVSVAVDRYNNTDVCLVLVLLLAAWAFLRATETGNRPLLYLALLLVGLGFDTKMMASFVALPAFYLAYMAGAPFHWLKRGRTLLIGTLILLVAALSWPLSPTHQVLLFWLVWFFTYAAVFSFMRGAMHPYYLVLMVPAIASLAGIGCHALWMEFQEGKKRLLVLGLLLTALGQAVIVVQYPDWRSQLLPILLSGVFVTAGGLFYWGRKSSAHLKEGLGR